MHNLHAKFAVLSICIAVLTLVGSLSDGIAEKRNEVSYLRGPRGQ